jgi:hypothetical protein
MHKVITDAAQVTPEWLTAVLHKSGCLPQGRYDYRFAVIGYLFYPIWQWSTDHPDFIWWHHLERLMLAFQDLGCEELLGL